MGAEAKHSTVTAAVLVLVACNLALVLSKLSPPPSDHERGARVEPVGYIASKLSTVLVAYASALAARHGRGLSLETLLAELRRTWTRPAMTELYIELLTTAMASLLLMLRALLEAASGAVAGFLAVSISVALVGWLGPVLFAHSDIACRMSLIVAVVEDGYNGCAAVQRAEALVTGRRMRGIAVAVAATVIEQAPAWWCGDAAPMFVAGPAVIVAKLFACYACALFYYGCRRRHDSITSKLKSEEMLKCCDIAWDCDLALAEKIETEELGSGFECFRWT